MAFERLLYSEALRSPSGVDGKDIGMILESPTCRNRPESQKLKTLAHSSLIVEFEKIVIDHMMAAKPIVDALPRGGEESIRGLLTGHGI